MPDENLPLPDTAPLGKQFTRHEFFLDQPHLGPLYLAVNNRAQLPNLEFVEDPEQHRVYITAGADKQTAIVFTINPKTHLVTVNQPHTPATTPDGKPIVLSTSLDPQHPQLKRGSFNCLTTGTFITLDHTVRPDPDQPFTTHPVVAARVQPAPLDRIKTATSPTS